MIHLFTEHSELHKSSAWLKNSMMDMHVIIWCKMGIQMHYFLEICDKP